MNTVILRPKRIAVIVPFSSELARNSAAEAVFNQKLRERAVASLGAAYFSTSASSGAAHAGLLNGLSPLTGIAIMQDDLAALAESVGNNGTGEVVFIISPGRFAAAKIRI